MANRKQTTEQPEPLRRINIAADLYLYVSDMGCLVLAADGFDLEDDEEDRQGSAIVIYPEHAAAVIKALQTLQPIAAAKESALHAVTEAQYQAEVAMGKHGD
jgi:hypothetical protein